MQNKFFGQFLLENAVISAEQLKAAVAAQEETLSTRLGIRAINAGFMSSEEVGKVKSLRAESGSSFGDIAVNEGFLSRERLETLLSSQMDDCVTLGEALVETKALNQETLGTQLESFNSDIYAEKVSPADLFKGRPNADVLEAIVNQVGEQSMKLLQVLLHADSCHGEVEKVKPCDYTLFQTFKGSWNGQIRLNVSGKFIQRISSKLSGEESVTINQTALDAATEFLSIAGGNIAATLSTMGKPVELAPPRYLLHAEWGERSGRHDPLVELVGDATLTVVPLKHSSETLELCIIDRSA